MTLWKGGGDTTELHWQGKFRGPEFEPITFKLETVHSKKVIDDRGREMPSVMATPVTDTEVAKAEKLAETDQNILLAIIDGHPPLSMAELAAKAKWTNARGGPDKSKVQRIVRQLVEYKLVEKYRNRYRATKLGKKELAFDA